MFSLGLPDNRAAAKLLGATHYWTGIPCVRGHVGKRATASGQCLECDVMWAKAARLKAGMVPRPDVRKTVEQLKARKKAVDAIRQSNDAYIIPNRERQRLRYHAKSKSDPNYVAAMKLRSSLHAKRNPAAKNASSGYRRFLRNNATPKWLTDRDFRSIQSFYNLALIEFQVTGVPHEVDHIVPLNHPDVCGLHVPWNLQVITQKENRAKGNNFTGLNDGT